MTQEEQNIQAAQHYAAQAAAVLAKLKTGKFDAVSALALVLIANSLAVLAARNFRSQQSIKAMTRSR